MMKLILAFLTFTYLDTFFISKDNNDVCLTEVEQFAECTWSRVRMTMCSIGMKVCFFFFSLSFFPFLHLVVVNEQ